MTITTRSCTAARMLTTPDRADLPWAAGWEASAACAARHDLPWVTDAADVTGAQGGVRGDSRTWDSFFLRRSCGVEEVFARVEG